MPEYDEIVKKHWSQTDLGDRILTALQNAGKDIDALTMEDISLIDQFHGGGLAATRELAQLASPREGMHVLDVGSGIGGPARTLAAEYGCYVTGLDLTEEFCVVAEMLTARLGLSDKVTFNRGSALDIPFEDETFDAVWMQNVSMNIEDKPKLYNEIRRVLRKGGLMAIQDAMAGPVSPIHFPVMWADDPSISFLISPEELRQMLRELGFKELAWNDVTQLAIDTNRRRMNAPGADDTPTTGVNLLVSRNFQMKTANGVRNYEEGRCVAITAVFERS